MKRAILLLIALSMLVCMFACKKPEVTEGGEYTDGNQQKHENFENDGKIEFWIYKQDHGSGWGNISTVTCADVDESYALVAALYNAKKTGKTVDKLSDDVITERGASAQYPVEFNTVWIVSSVGLYRMPPDRSQICSVETHFGEGTVLEMTDELKNAIEGAWNYSPYYIYRGTYTAGDETVKLEVTNEGDSPIRMYIKEIQIQKELPCENRIVVEVVSSEDCDAAVALKSQQGYDNIGGSTHKYVHLKKDVPQLVELEYEGFSYNHTVQLSAKKTRAVIQIKV